MQKEQLSRVEQGLILFDKLTDLDLKLLRVRKENRRKLLQKQRDRVNQQYQEWKACQTGERNRSLENLALYCIGAWLVCYLGIIYWGVRKDSLGMMYWRKIRSCEIVLTRNLAFISSILPLRYARRSLIDKI